MGGVLLASLCALLPTTAEACVGCREPGTQTIDHESPTVLAGMAFSWSVIFMLTVVLALVAAMSLYIWRTCARLDRDRAAGVR